MQIVFDHSFQAINILAKLPGSVHDARILSESELKKIFERRIVYAGCHLPGDSCYPCQKWVLTYLGQVRFINYIFISLT